LASHNPQCSTRSLKSIALYDVVSFANRGGKIVIKWQSSRTARALCVLFVCILTVLENRKVIAPNYRLHQYESCDQLFDLFEFTLVEDSPAALALIPELTAAVLERRGWAKQDIEFMMNIDIGSFFP